MDQEGKEPRIDSIQTSRDIGPPEVQEEEEDGETMKLYKRTEVIGPGIMVKFVPLEVESLERVLEDLVKIIRGEDTFDWCLLEMEALGILAEIRKEV